MLHACDELGNKYAEAHKERAGAVGGGEPRQSRRAGVLAWTINLCLFQSESWPNQCKIRAGMSSISVNLSIPLCVGSCVMDWFCHLCSAHSMLTWKSAVRLWRRVITVPALTRTYYLLQYHSTFLSVCWAKEWYPLRRFMQNRKAFLLHSTPPPPPVRCSALVWRSLLFTSVSNFF